MQLTRICWTKQDLSRKRLAGGIRRLQCSYHSASRRLAQPASNFCALWCFSLTVVCSDGPSTACRPVSPNPADRSCLFETQTGSDRIACPASSLFLADGPRRSGSSADVSQLRGGFVKRRLVNASMTRSETHAGTASTDASPRSSEDIRLASLLTERLDPARLRRLCPVVVLLSVTSECEVGVMLPHQTALRCRTTVTRGIVKSSLAQILLGTNKAKDPHMLCIAPVVQTFSQILDEARRVRG